MRRARHGSGLKLALAVGLLLTGVIAWAQWGGQFDLSWWTIDGGGVSNGGGYDLTCVIGQPDAGVLTGGPYTLEGGFLSSEASARSGASEWRIYGDR